LETTNTLTNLSETRIEEESQKQEEDEKEPASKRVKLQVTRRKAPSYENYKEIFENLEKCVEIEGKKTSFKFRLSEKDLEPSELIFKDLSYPFKEESLRKIYSTLPKGSFGDQKKLETRQDDKVRNARDIFSSEINASPKLLATLKEWWRRNTLVPKDVEVIPYKVNFYAQGGKFLPHKDTPLLHFVGTIVVCLFNTSNAIFKVQDQQFNLGELECVGFYGDAVHELKEITNNGFRVTLTLNVFAKDETWTSGILNQFTDLKIDEIKKQLVILIEKYRNFGILSNRMYCLEENENGLKGLDAYLYHILRLIQQERKQAGKPFVLQNVCVVEKYEKVEFDFDSMVYLLRDEDMIAYMNKKSLPPVDKFLQKLKGKICFFSFKRNGMFEWKDNVDHGAEWAGNESRPFEQNSIYLYKAFLIL
jgi:hypothetical protein